MANTCHGEPPEEVSWITAVGRGSSLVVRQSCHTVVRAQGQDQLRLQTQLIN